MSDSQFSSFQEFYEAVSEGVLPHNSMVRVGSDYVECVLFDEAKEKLEEDYDMEVFYRFEGDMSELVLEMLKTLDIEADYDD